MVDRLESLLSALRAERALSLDQRKTGAGDVPLNGAIDKVGQARDRLAAGDRAAAAERLAQVAHQVVDSWSYTSALSAEVVDCAQALRRG